MVLWRKVGIAFLLSLGAFVMAIAIARCTPSVDNDPGVAQLSNWIFCKAPVTIFTVNAPFIPALVRLRTLRLSRSRVTGFANPYSKSSSASHKLPPTIESSQSKPKGLQGHKMTDFETTSKGSTSNLV